MQCRVGRVGASSRKRGGLSYGLVRKNARTEMLCLNLRLPLSRKILYEFLASPVHATTHLILQFIVECFVFGTL